MKCPKCGGTGEMQICEMGFIGKDECDKCHGKGYLTNEEWFDSLSTEEKAEWLADHMKCSKCPQQNRCNGYHGGCMALMLEWLKQPHEQKGD